MQSSFLRTQYPSGEVHLAWTDFIVFLCAIKSCYGKSRQFREKSIYQGRKRELYFPVAVEREIENEICRWKWIAILHIRELVLCTLYTILAEHSDCIEKLSAQRKLSSETVTFNHNKITVMCPSRILWVEFELCLLLLDMDRWRSWLPHNSDMVLHVPYLLHARSWHGC